MESRRGMDRTLSFYMGMETREVRDNFPDDMPLQAFA